MTAPNASTALATTLVDELVRCGLRHVVVCPGSRSTALAVAVDADPRITTHVHPDERSAAFVALGIGRATGLPAAVVVTSGTAVANLHPAVVEADTDRVPLLLLTADRPAELRHTGANQAIDQVDMFGAAARWSVDLPPATNRPDQPALWRTTADRAWAAATGAAGGRAGGATAPGPVQLNIGFREPTVPVADDGRAAPDPFDHPTQGRPDGEPWLRASLAARSAPDLDLQRVAARIAGTERGMIVVGGGGPVPQGHVLDAIVAVADAAGWPVIAEPHAPVPVGRTTIAHATPLLGHAGFARSHVPDLVLRVGRTTLSRPLERLLGAHVPQVLIDPHGGWSDPTRTASQVLVADAERLFTDLATVLPLPASSVWLDGWLRADRAVRDVADERLGADEGGPVGEAALARALVSGLPDGTTLLLGSSTPVRDVDAWAAPRDGLRVLANRGASGIDGTVSTALGAALTHVGPTVLLCGDLTFLHDANGWLLSPGSDGDDLVTVVVDNDGGGIFHRLPQAQHATGFERLFGTPHGRDLGVLGAFHGLSVATPTSVVGAVEAVRAGIERGGRHLVHVRTDRHAAAAAAAELRAAVDAALDAIA